MSKVIMKIPAANKAALLALCLAAIAAMPALAERADRDKPVSLEADRVAVDDTKQTSTFEGKVKLTQGTLEIDADKIVVRQDAEGYQHGTAYGDLAHFRQKREGYDEYIEGYGERIEYDGKTEKVEFYTRASMKRGADEVHGDYILYDSVTEFFQVKGNLQQANGGSRVRAVILPKPKPAPAAPAQPQ
ncbi:MAG: lipopolysaccharide transport periplasmic protein LptA [Pseudomonadota bacterium]